MSVTSINLIIQKGTDFEATFIISAEDGSLINLTSHSATAKIRKYPSSPISFNFNVSLNISKSSIKIQMPRETTTLLSTGRNYFDILLKYETENQVTKVVTGTIIVEETSTL
jgi:hypothetical protein